MGAFNLPLFKVQFKFITRLCQLFLKSKKLANKFYTVQWNILFFKIVCNKNNHIIKHDIKHNIKHDIKHNINHDIRYDIAGLSYG